MTETLVSDGCRLQRRRIACAMPAVQGASFDRDYWVGHCEGFRVDSADGRLGLVEEVRIDEEGVATFAVRAGRRGRRLLLVPAAEVAFIVPRAGRIWLRSPVSILGTEARA